MICQFVGHVTWLVVLCGLGSCQISPSKTKSIESRVAPRSTLTPTYLSKIDSTIQTAIDNGLIPGAVILIQQNGKMLHSGAFGYAKLYDYHGKMLTAPEPMTFNHRFDLASLTKVFATTFGIMLLVDQGKIHLDSPINRFISDFRGISKDSVTIRHLLTHTAGLKEWKPIYYHTKNEREARQHICEIPLKYAVGKERHYSDLGFMLLGYLIEEVTKDDLNNFLQKNLYRPLGLMQTTFVPGGEHPPFAATSHGNPFERKMVSDDSFGFLCDEEPGAFQGWRNYTLVGEVNDGNAFYAHGGVAGHAGLFSTAADLAILLELLLNNGTHLGQEVISEAVVKQFLTKDHFGHGLGWAMSSRALPLDELPTNTFGHTGFTGTFVLGFPTHDAQLILLTNRQNLGVQSDGRYHSIDDLRQKVTSILVAHLTK